MNRTLFLFLCILISLTFFDLGKYEINDNFYSGDVSGVTALVKTTLWVIPIALITILSALRVNNFTISFTGIIRNLLTSRSLLTLFIIGAVSSIWSPLPTPSLTRAASGLVALTSCSAVVFAIQTGIDRKLIDPKSIVTYLCAGFSIAFLIAYFYWTLSYGSESVWINDRFGGRMIPPNTLGAASGIIFGLSALAFERSDKFQNKVIFAALLALNGTILFFTFSRAAIIATYISFIVVGLVSLRRRLFLLSLFIIFITLLFATTEDLSEVLQRGDFDSLSTASGRTDLWIEIFSKIDWRIFFGYGYGMLSNVGYAPVGTLLTFHAHNVYLQVLAGMGLIGLIIFLVFAANAISIVRRSIKSDPFIGHAYVYLLSFFFVNGFSEASVGYQIVPQFVFLIIIFQFVSRRLQSG